MIIPLAFAALAMSTMLGGSGQNILNEFGPQHFKSAGPGGSTNASGSPKNTGNAGLAGAIAGDVPAGGTQTAGATPGNTGNPPLSGIPTGGFEASFVPSSTSAVPEPQTYALMMAGLGVVGWLQRRRKPR